MLRSIPARAAPWLLVAILVAIPTAGEGQASYLNFDDFTDELRDVVNDSDFAEMRSIGTSREGREIWLVTLADPRGLDLEYRPGVLVVANLSGDHVVGSHLALETIRHLLSDDSEANLSANVVYVVPRLNPDGAEHFFADVATGRTTNSFAYDADNDGRIDEDAPDDLNGDGAITLMRVDDLGGPFMVDPDDSRLMKRADPAAGERGTHRVYIEGLDDDGDGFYNEDANGGVDLDRNFQHAYAYWQDDVGVHMVSEPSTRALMDFTIAQRNIAAIVTFGHSDNLVTPPTASGVLADAVGIEMNGFADESFADMLTTGVLPTPFVPGTPNLRGAQPGADNDPNSGRRPEMTVNGSDRDYFVAVSDAYKEITGIEEIPLRREAQGAFFQYGYYQFGVPSFSTPGVPMPELADDAPSGGDARLLAAFEDDFVGWTSYDHPDLGAGVQIGGFRPYAMTNPDAADLAELGASHGAFVARVTTMLPDIMIVGLDSEDHGGGLFTVSVTVQNEGFFPTATAQGVTSRTVDPVLVQIQVDATAIVTGAAKSHRITSMDGTGTQETVSWVIRGDSGDRVEVVVWSEKGGRDATTVQLGGDR